MLARPFAPSRRSSVSVPASLPQVLDFFGTPLVIELSPGQLTSNAGLLPNGHQQLTFWHG